MPAAAWQNTSGITAIPFCTPRSERGFGLTEKTSHRSAAERIKRHERRVCAAAEIRGCVDRSRSRKALSTAWQGAKPCAVLVLNMEFHNRDRWKPTRRKRRKERLSGGYASIPLAETDRKRDGNADGQIASFFKSRFPSQPRTPSPLILSFLREKGGAGDGGLGEEGEVPFSLRLPGGQPLFRLSLFPQGSIGDSISAYSTGPSSHQKFFLHSAHIFLRFA